MISVDPITSWPIILPDNSIKKLPILLVLCRQTGFVWHKILYDWTTRSFTLAIMILQYRYGRVHDILSDQGSNMIPMNLNPGISVDGEEKILMSIIHKQCPVGAQHENTVESRIRLIKQFALNMIGQVKGERYKPLSITQTDFILAAALYEINNIPLFRHEKYLYLTPQAIVNPLFEMSVGKLEENIMDRYYENLEPYLKLIKELRFACFVKYVTDKTYSNHALIRDKDLNMQKKVIL